VSNTSEGKPEGKSEVRNKANRRQAERTEWFNYAGLKRGVWFQHQYYPQGIAILDWNSKFTGNSISAMRHRQHRQERNQENEYIEQREQATQVETDHFLEQIAYGWVQAENQEELQAARTYYFDNAMSCAFRGTIRSCVENVEEA
jgi:hypothetical protein